MANSGDCRWPRLDPPYDRALREAVAFILERYEPLGIVAAGAVLRGTPDDSSDLDLCVLHAAPWRQRVQKRFGGVPAEIFVNPEASIEAYFESESRSGAPMTAHMYATGFVVLERGPLLAGLRAKARAILERGPQPSEQERTLSRYLAAALHEDAVDRLAHDPETARLILGLSVERMLRHAFIAARRWQPRAKDLLAETEALDPELGAWARAFYACGPRRDAAALAERIADRTLGARGFFEWESEPDPVRTSPHDS